jgi:hypothetical protein
MSLARRVFEENLPVLRRGQLGGPGTVPWIGVSRQDWKPEKDASFQAEIGSSSGDESDPSIQSTRIPGRGYGLLGFEVL